jgi:uncharacterized protein
MLQFPCYSQRELRRTWYENKVPREVFYVLKKNPAILDSLYISYYHNSNINIKGYYKNNKASGPWEYYYQNGSLKMKGEFADDLYEGHWIYFYENGNKNREGSMIKGKKEGKWVYYYENGNVKNTGNYRNDSKEGIWNYYMEDGQTFKAQSVFSDDKGKYKEYYPEGKLKSEGDIIDNRSTGIWKYYYEDGTLKAEGFEKNGQKEGMWKFYHPNGKLASEGAYENGKSKGVWKYYYENGVLSSEGQEIDGSKDGKWTLYYKNGSFRGEGEFRNGEGPYKEYYEDGKLKIEGFIKNNKNEGRWKYYYESGELEGECYFTNGSGNYIGYYPGEPRKLKIKGRIENGLKTGKWEVFDEEGNVSGYIRNFHEDETPVIEPVEEVVADATPHQDSTGRRYPTWDPPRKKLRYFKPVVNEFKGFIISSSPFAPLKSSIPINVEYYLQERLGHEFNFTYIRRPLFRDADLNELSRVGFSTHIRQKFYQRDQDKGMFYLGHELRYTQTKSVLNVSDTTLDLNTRKLKGKEKLVEYCIIAGDRLVRDARRQGYSFDVFVGLGMGYRFFDRGYPHDKELDKYIVNAGQGVGNFSLAVRLGLNVGFAISKKKLYKTLTGY